jgi:hypothetical protein
MIRIFIEGNEGFFLKEIIRQRWPERLSKIDIVSIGGKDNIRKIIPQFTENTDAGGINLIIFDADKPIYDGGFAIRKTEIEEIINRNNIQARLFLFPDNQSDGDFETLLAQLIHTNHNALTDCFERYKDCLSSLNDSNTVGYMLPNQKSKIYAFVSALPLSRAERSRMGRDGDWIFENDSIWNLNHEILNPLIAFLQGAFNV